MMLLELDYPISTNRMWRNFNGRMVMSAEGKKYKETAAWLAKAAGVKKALGDVEVTIILHPKMNKDGTASKTRIDLDNAIKCAVDSLNGIAYIDDKQIVRLIAEVGSAKREGGLTISIKEL